MIGTIFKRLGRAYIPAVAILLFSAVVTASLGFLQASSDTATREYEEFCESFPYTVTVTDPWGGYNGRVYVNGEPEWAPNWFSVKGWVYTLFTEDEPVRFYDLSGIDEPNYNKVEVNKRKEETEPVEISLAEYLTDIQVKLSLTFESVNGQIYYSEPELIGITSLACDTQLSPEDGCELIWYEGYDESIFDGNEPYCLIPEGKAELYDNGNGEAEIGFNIRLAYIKYENGEPTLDRVEWLEHQFTVKIAGTYTGGDWGSIYCPVSVIEGLCAELDVSPSVYSLRATLTDSSRLEEFLDKASFCLPEASLDAVETLWEHSADEWYNEVYLMALDINDEELDEPRAKLEEKIERNRKFSLIVIYVAAAVGFAIAFIASRARKRDFILMRTAGESKSGIYLRFIIEQMICIILGIAVGGAYFLWKPADKIALFALIVLAEFTLALAILMSRKLLTIIKEEK